MLRRLWSPTGLLDEINFRAGLNLILGRYASARVPSDGINGIGKSSVIRLIDFLLLSESQRKRFTSPKYGWMATEGHLVCLDLEVGGTLLTIRRSFGKDVRMVSLKVGAAPEFEVEDTQAVGLLNDRFFRPAPGRTGIDSRFRSLMPFYIKDDLTAHTREDPVRFLTHSGVNQLDMTVLTMYLLGLPNEGLVKLDNTRAQFDAEKALRNNLKRQLESETGRPIEVLRTELSATDKHIGKLTEALSEFNLLENFSDVSAALGKLEAEAAEQRKVVTQAGRQLDKLRRFFEVTPDLDTEDVTAQYRSVLDTLGAAVKKSLDEVLAFRQSMAQQRLRFHGKRLLELESLRNEAMRKLTALEDTRSNLMRAVHVTDFRETFEGALRNILERHATLDRSRSLLAELARLEKRMSDLELTMEQYRHEAIAALSEVDSEVSRIRERYLQIVQEAVTYSPEQREGAYFDIATPSTAKGKKLPVQISVSLPRADALGSARLLLVAYDLTVFLHQLDQSLGLPRFLVHDGAFHAVARRTIVRTLNFVQREANRASLAGHPFQYIVTFNEDEVALANDGQSLDGDLEFDIADATVATLSDDPAHMLFKRRFG